MKFILYAVFLSGAWAGTRVIRDEHEAAGWSAPGHDMINITEEGSSIAVGLGHAVAEHDSTISLSGSEELPAQLMFITGTDAGLSNSVANLQESQINADGSSQALQANTAANSGYTGDNLAGDAIGLEVDVHAQGWSDVSGVGAVQQDDLLEHTGPIPEESGWSMELPSEERKVQGN